MIVGRATHRDLKGWADGPKVVLDYFNFWATNDFPEGVHLIRVDPRYDIPAMIERYSPVCTYFVTSYRYTIESLSQQFPNINFYELEDQFDV